MLNDTKSSLKPKLLLVEDNKVVMRFYTIALAKIDCFIVKAETGRKALSYVNEDVDLIILDFGLPDISGFEVSRCFRKTQMHKETPIICITANNTCSEGAFKSAGIDQMLAKPVLHNQLYQTLYEWLPQYFESNQFATE